MQIFKPVIIVVFIALLNTSAICQDNINDSSLSGSKISDIYNQYISSIAGALLLYNGAEYTASYTGVQGTPFFLANDFETGLVWYNGIRYSNIPLKYDLVTGQVVTKGFQNESICLVKEKIDSFHILNHHFVKPADDSRDIGAAAYRFYDLLYSGKTISFMAKREKIIKAALHAEDPSSFAVYTTYFLVKENDFYKVSSKKDVMNILGKGNDAMKAFWKNNKLDFKKDMENSVQKSADFYDQIKK